MVRKKSRKSTKKVSINTEKILYPALQKLKERLMSPRLRAPGTISTYLGTGGRFLSGLEPGQVPSDSDFRRYFIRRREEGTKERTLTKEFFHLKKLCEANGWAWPFSKDDTPYSEEDANAPAHTREQVEQLIQAGAKLTETEKFYLAIATTWIVRREDLARVKKRDYDGETIIIHTSKKGRQQKHLIPDALRPIFAEYRAKEHTPAALSQMYKRICEAAGIEHQKGWGWHCIRRTLTTLLGAFLPANNLDPALLADYSGWSKKSLGKLYGGAVMVGVYRHPEILFTDPYGRDKVIYEIHPFLPLWVDKKTK